MAPWSKLVPWTRDPSPGRLVQECEWLLAGRYVELREREGAPVPRWAWANRLAHRRWAGRGDARPLRRRRAARPAQARRGAPGAMTPGRRSRTGPTLGPGPRSRRRCRSAT